MTQKTIKTSTDETYSEGPKQNFTTHKTDVYHIDYIWIVDVLDLKDFDPENSRNHRYDLIIFDNFSKFCRIVPLKNANAIAIKDLLGNILRNSKRKPNLIETDRGREIYNNIFQNFPNNNNIKHFSRKTSLGAVFAERFNRTIRDLPKRPVFEKCAGDWIDISPTITKHFKNRVHTPTKLSPIQASLKQNEGYVYKKNY